jgi:hypothetical protein
VKYRGLLNQVKALRAQLAPSAGVRIVIRGGLPEGYQVPQPKPPGSDLHKQHEIFGRDKRPASAPGEAAKGRAADDRPTTTPVPKPAPRAS